MGRFGDYVKKAKETYDEVGGAAGIRERVTQYRDAHARDYAGLHGTMPGLREYVSSDAGRASARLAGARAVDAYLGRSIKKANKSGSLVGTVKSALFNFAQLALSSHLKGMAHDQRIFENVARVKRGDPEVVHMSHNELRDVVDHAKRYGGKHTNLIHEAAQSELDRRGTRKHEEWDRAAARQDQAKLERKLKSKTALHDQSVEFHKDRLARTNELRKSSAKTQSQKIAYQKALTQQIKAQQAAKTKGLKDRQNLKELGKSKSGKTTYVMTETGKKISMSTDALKGSKGAKGAGRAKRSVRG